MDFDVVEWGTMLIARRSPPSPSTSHGDDGINNSLGYTDPSTLYRLFATAAELAKMADLFKNPTLDAESRGGRPFGYGDAKIQTVSNKELGNNVVQISTPTLEPPQVDKVNKSLNAAFGLGEDDTHISSVDADGVALAGVQALYRMLLQKDEEIAQQRKDLQKLEAQIEALRAALTQTTARDKDK